MPPRRTAASRTSTSSSLSFELRLDRFGGTVGALSKINYHVIFSDEVDPDVIEAQFIAALSKGYALSPQYSALKNSWKALPTRASLEDLGRKIIESVPADKRRDYKSPLIEGFNNSAFSLETVKEALESHYFEGKCLTAVGKTEWADIKWSDHSIADKKNLINDVDLVFISADSPTAWRNAEASLRTSHVNARLLDCSDAHSFSSSGQKDRLGNSFTWIKADTTFQGLRQAVIEFDDRVFVGETPDKMRRVEANRTKYVRGLTIRRLPGAPPDEEWFDCSLDFNTDLVAVIGNKGSGKSALLDILGLLGSSKEADYFSFLTRDKFRQPRDNKSRHFKATLTWSDDTTIVRTLDAIVPATDVETIKYIPQSFLETICNEDSAGSSGRFDAELKKVIFSHVGDSDRLGYETLDDLISYRAEQIYDSIAIIKRELLRINEEVVDLEGRVTPEHRRTLEGLLESKRQELRAHEASRPESVTPPELDPAGQSEAARITEALESAKRRLTEHNTLVTTALDAQKRQARTLAAADRLLGRIENIRRQVQTTRQEMESDLAVLGISVDEVVQFRVSTASIDQARARATQGKSATDAQLAPSGPASLIAIRGAIEGEINELQGRLDAPQRRYQEFLQKMAEWERVAAELRGSVNLPGSIVFYEGQVEDLNTLPERLRDAYRRRIAKSQEIYREIGRLASEYRVLYEPVQRFIDEHAIAKDRLNLRFEVSIGADAFRDGFLDVLNQRVIGSFSGVDEGTRVVADLVAKYRFDREEDVEAFTEDVLAHLRADHRGGSNTPVRVSDQLRSGKTLQQLYELVFSLEYLVPRYVLRLGEKELHELSPGERGALLLIFYLLVDKGDIPLAIDQPEENLDNQTVYELLVPCIREAKGRRQIFVVTHNPNLAVVCDAEQIIYARHDKAAKNRVTYETGAIENQAINRRIVDVLEGTRPAFDKRDSKYI